MDKQEYNFAQQVIAESRCNTCNALQEANDELIEENKRLRNKNRILHAMKRQLSLKLLESMQHSDEIFDAMCNQNDPHEWKSQADGFITAPSLPVPLVTNIENFFEREIIVNPAALNEDALGEV